MSLVATAALPRAEHVGRALTNRGLVTAVSILFLLPSALFAISLTPHAACAVMAGCVGAAVIVISRPSTDAEGFMRQPIRWRSLAFAIGCATTILLLGGETHLFFAPSDWQIRDSVLADVVRHGLPVSYVVDGKDYLLRAPLGMYMLPGVVGQIFGLSGAHIALVAQNALVLGAILYVLMSVGRGIPHLVILVLFAGVPILGCLMRSVSDGRTLMYYVQWHLDGWHPLFLQYSSSMVQFVWVPNHALPGWFLAVLLILNARSELDVATLGVSVAGLCFWSPLAVLGAVPWLAYRAVTEFWTHVASLRNWGALLAGAGFVPIAAYLVSASGSIAHGSATREADFGFWYLLFVAVQLPSLAFIGVFWRRVPSHLRSLMFVNAVWLLVLPVFKFGPNNDLVMRGSIASLAILAFVFGLVLLDLLRGVRTGGEPAGARVGPGRLSGAAIGTALVILAAPSAAMELWRAVTTPRYAISDCSLIQASHALGDKGLPTNYLAQVGVLSAKIVDARAATPASVADKACWPDLRPLVDPDKSRRDALNRS